MKPVMTNGDQSSVSSSVKDRVLQQAAARKATAPTAPTAPNQFEQAKAALKLKAATTAQQPGVPLTSTPSPAVKSILAGQARSSPGTAAPIAAVRTPPFTITSAARTKDAKWFKMLVYGNYGVGKTTLMASAVDIKDMRDVLMINAEGGDMSIYDGTIKNAPKIDIIRVTTFKQMAYIKDFLVAHAKFREADDEVKLAALQKAVLGGDSEPDRLRRYKTIIVDSLAEIESYCMYDLLGVTEGYSLAADMPTAEFKEYKQNFNKINLLVRGLRDLPMHILMTSSQQYDQDELKKYHYSPNLTGKLAGNVQGFFDILGYLMTSSPTEEKEAPRRLWVQPVGGKFDAKNRRASIKQTHFDDPTMESIMRAVGLVK